ncbi:MAG: GTP 3',8-cyclase MoaA [Dehalococcoidia bacterium]|nr:MAG: GTP 3',8-cyclase MoaA [Chloroflexota bacterium]|tara:strand:+ start:1230 stop:2246 length:1017 start_codon:yes stop_codon:yes gene_type:complete
MKNIFDKLNRPVKDLRISVTDRCNFRCTYCMPKEVYGEAFKFLPKKELLDFDEIEKIAKVFASIGVTKIRLTGGEPLVRKNIESLIKKLSRIDGIEDIAMTTNGYLLEPKIDDLINSGLNRITVSLDAIDELTFKKMSDQNFDVNKVLSAIEMANKKGFEKIKINCVVQKGVNEHSILDLLDYFKYSKNIVRFIEYMDVGNLNGWELSQVLSVKEILEIIEKKYKVRSLEKNYHGEVAKRYMIEDYSTEFGFISSVSKPFCTSCTRARITMDGKLVTCLFANNGLDLREPLRQGCTQEELNEIISNVWTSRSDRYSEIRHKLTADKNHKKIEMFQIGG